MQSRRRAPGRIGPAALLAAAGVLAAGAAPEGQLPGGSITRDTGQSVAPVYEGWYETEDGGIEVSFGYMNRNWQEAFDIPCRSRQPDLPRPRRSGPADALRAAPADRHVHGPAAGRPRGRGHVDPHEPGRDLRDPRQPRSRVPDRAAPGDRAAVPRQHAAGGEIRQRTARRAGGRAARTRPAPRRSDSRWRSTCGSPTTGWARFAATSGCP